MNLIAMKIWCDGAYKPSLNQGGVGIVWVENDKVIKKFSKGYKKTETRKVTNQTMEMLSVMIALNAIQEPIEDLEIITDSMYVIGGASLGWKRKANIQLWIKFDEILAKTKKLVKNDIIFTHTYGHKDDIYNNLADELASDASKEFIE